MARYMIDVTTVWNDADHGPLPGNAHWSDLVGTTHNSSVTFWEVGQLASPGIEDVAEIGNNDDFESEVNSAISSGDATQWMRGAFNPFAAISNANMTDIIVSEDHPLLTLAAMIAPSPDWFIGVNGLSLLDGGSNWRTSITVDLFAYDAGTEQGSGYSTSNPAENPHVPISSLINVAPFNDQKVATLTITLQEVLGVADLNFGSSVRISPNPVQETINIINSSSYNIEKLELFNVLGNRVLTINAEEQNGMISISANQLRSGIYVLSIESTDGRRTTKKLVKR